MRYFTVGAENGADIRICYQDQGSGHPVALIHGYRSTRTPWERQERVLLAAGTGSSPTTGADSAISRPTVGYDHDTFAADLNTLAEHLGLTGVLLGGFTIGTREVTRCLARYGSGRVAKAVMFGVIPPFLLKTENNPEGVDRQEFENIKASIVNDRYASFEDFLNNFCNTDRAWQASFIVASGASPYATLVEAAKRAGVTRIIAQSIAWAYAPGDSPADESSPLDLTAQPPRANLIDRVMALEETAAELAENVILRNGTLYGPGTWYSPGGLADQQLRRTGGTGAVPGPLIADDGVSSFVHVEDAARAAVAALDWPSGAVNIVDDEPAPARDWLPVLADALGAPVSPCRHRAGRLAARRQQRPGTRPRLDAAVPVLANRLRRDEDNLTAPWVPLLHPPPHPGSGERADEPVQVGVRLPPVQSEARRAQPVQDRVRHHESRPKGLVLRRSGTCQTGTQ
jgi:non-heme chloroperoxidase